MFRARSAASLVLLLSSLVSACGEETAPEPAAPAPNAAAPTPPKSTKLDRVPRATFNRRAAELALPLFWRADDNGDGTIDVVELVVTTSPILGKRSDYVGETGFSPTFTKAYADIEAPIDLTKLPADEQKRREAVLAELAQGRPTLIHNDFREGSPEDRAIVKHIQNAARIVEKIHARQNGVLGLDGKIPADDAASRMLFARNQGPHCEAPKTESDPACRALAEGGKKVSGLYPASLQADPKFCEALEKHKDTRALMAPFVVVKESPAKPGELVAVPYTVEYKEDMEAVSAELLSAASAIVDTSEAAFKTYLTAAAASFKSNDWQPADEAWSKMSAANSKWYLRIGPDEVYFEPCSRKAGFHVSFARINQDSVEWQQKLDPVKGELEKALADLAGPPYIAREVTFHLPDFIDIVINAGDSRPAHGATIGQSLPNWGPVANEGRGRTVAMTNLYTDKDSEAAWKEQASSLFCKDTMAKATFEPKYGTMSTVLHEAAHNLGPAHEYKVCPAGVKSKDPQNDKRCKTDDEVFSGPLASTLEELKAQTAALYLSEWLVGKKLLTQEAASFAHLRDTTWAFGHIAQGMYTADKKPKAYSQLASIQFGHLHKAGVLVWKASDKAANGSDSGCFDVDLTKWKPAVDELAKTVLGIKGRGDKELAEKVKAEFVDDISEWSKLRATIQERWLRAPKASFVYAVEL